MRAFLFAPFVVMASAGALSAQSASDMVFSRDAGCFSRLYEPDHLVAHPQQQVMSMLLHADSENMAHDSTDDLLVWVEIRVKDSMDVYSGVAICGPEGASMTCWMEGDAGGFTLANQDGRLRLDVGPDGMSFEGQTGYVTLSATKGDDRVFLLDGGACY